MSFLTRALVVLNIVFCLISLIVGGDRHDDLMQAGLWAIAWLLGERLAGYQRRERA